MSGAGPSAAQTVIKTSRRKLAAEEKTTNIRTR